MTIVAIDFGTSNTAIAILDLDGTSPKTLSFGDVSRGFETAEGIAWLVPSLVYVSGRDRFLVGEQARFRDQSKRLFQGFKRDIIANFRSPAREIDGDRYDAEAIADIFLT